MIILFGPSASGKTEVANMLTNKYKIKKVITCTTREKRLGEEEGIDYFFLTKDQLKREFKEGKLVEMTNYNNQLYGTRVSEIQDDKVLILDPNGVKTFTQLNNKNIIVFYLHASEVTRFNRMIIRKDDIKKAHSRIENDHTAFKEENMPKYDYLLNTDEITIEQAADIVYSKYKELLKSKK